jgi:hypothetical protein
MNFEEERAMHKVHLLLAALAMTLALAGVSWAGFPVMPVGEEEIAPTSESIGHQSYLLRTSVTPDSLQSAIVTGADYLQAMQADVTEDNAGNGFDGIDENPDDPDDGGWDWRVTTPSAPVAHTTAASPTNVYGATGQGLYYAYILTGDSGYFTALADAANAMIADPDIDSGADLVFLINYNDLPGVTGTAYQDSAKAKYDARIATHGSAKAWAEYIRDARAGQGYENGIIAWDIGIWAVAAAKLDDKYGGYAADADSIAEVLWQDSFNDNPGYFDIVDDAGWDSTYANTDYYWYTLGISGLIDGFIAADLHTDELGGLATLITDSQYASGAVSFSYGANTNDEDWQSTAYCALSLARYDHATYQDEIKDMGGWTADTQDALTGGWRYSNGNHYPEIAGENIAGMYFAYRGYDTVAADPAGICLSTVDTCLNVPVVFTRADVSNARGASVTIQLSAEIELCGSITQGDWLSGFTNQHYQVIDNGGGSYTIDQAILGTPCGVTTGGTLFDVPVQKAAGVTTDSTGTIAVTAVLVRDCNNFPLPGIAGAPATIPIDITAPVAVTDLAAAQKKTGNDSDGTTKITLSFSVPGDADSVMVFRKGYGDYPEYNDGTGAVPSVPATPAAAIAAGWALTDVTTTGQSDEPATRDFWYYVAFTEDACNNVSAVSNMTGGTLNYHLGDVTDGTTPGNGDNLVGGLDVSLLGANYGITLTYGAAYNYLDVGPTTDYSVSALPTTDDVVGFEDLMMFAINYGQVSLRGGSPVASQPSDKVEQPVLVMTAQAGEQLVVHLLLRQNETAVKGIHSVLAYDAAALSLVEVAQGDLVARQTGLVFFKSLEQDAGVVVDAALMGRNLTFAGSGEVATLTFDVLEPGSMPHLATAALRDVNNRTPGESPNVAEVDGATAAAVGIALPTHYEHLGARPNPFRGRTDIVFRLPEPREVSLNVYDVRGRLVTSLVERVLPAGEHHVAWDGRKADGRAAAAGVYFYTLRAGNRHDTHKLLLVR